MKWRGEARKTSLGISHKEQELALLIQVKQYFCGCGNLQIMQQKYSFSTSHFLSSHLEILQCIVLLGEGYPFHSSVSKSVSSKSVSYYFFVLIICPPIFLTFYMIVHSSILHSHCPYSKFSRPSIQSFGLITLCFCVLRQGLMLASNLLYWWM